MQRKPHRCGKPALGRHTSTFTYMRAMAADIQTIFLPSAVAAAASEDRHIPAHRAGLAMTKSRIALLCSLAFASANAFACYTVYDRSGRVVYQNESAPVDMSRQLHETVPARFPGGHMVFDAAADCPAVIAGARFDSRHSLSSPLLTDRRAAQSMRVPYTDVGNGIAMVQPRDATLAAGVTVIPSTVTAGVPATAVMGAGPNRRSRPVITELRDPPLIIEESNGRLTVRERKH
jgi:hypothetical protein